MIYLKNILLYLTMAVSLNALSHWLGSDFLNNFCNDNIIILLVSVLAVNIAIASILIPKLKDAVDKHNADFSNTYQEIKISFKEHIFLMITAIMVLIVKHSQELRLNIECLYFISDTLLMTILIYGIALLWDTGNALFIITQNEDNNEDK